MNLLLLWTAFARRLPPPAPALTCILMAAAVLSLEMQIVTWTGIGTARVLVPVNAAGALAAWMLWTAAPRETSAPVLGRGAWTAIALIAGVVLLLNVTQPLTGADPYHLQRVELIEQTGTLAYEPGAADVKVNALAGIYEMLLADLGRVPLVGSALLRLHGLLNLLLYAVAVSVVLGWLAAERWWGAAVLLTIPVVFHQFVLVKNDLFGAVPAFVALAWLATRAGKGGARELIWASWLAGMSVGIKFSSAPVAIVFFAGVAIVARADWRALALVIAGGLAGAVSAGFLFTIVENARVYGGVAAPYALLGNRTTSVREAVIGVARFAVSLGDLGLLTRGWWPGRGGWGGTFGLPLVWALALLVVRRHLPEARRTLWIAAGCFGAFAAAYPDADLAHRLVLAPGLLIVTVAASRCGGVDRVSRGFRVALVAVLILSALQIGRSAWLYAAGVPVSAEARAGRALPATHLP